MELEKIFSENKKEKERLDQETQMTEDRLVRAE